MNSHPFWDFLNEAYNNGPGGAPAHARGRGNQNQNDFQNWQDVFGNGFPFAAPMPHRGRAGQPPPPAPGAPRHPPPPHGPADAPHPPRPSTPPSPPEELPQYPGDKPHHSHPPPRSGSHSPPPPPHHGHSGDERPRHGRHARHQRREERREERREDREDRREEREERREERRERHRGRHWGEFEGAGAGAGGFGGPPPFFGGRGGRHCRGRGGRGGARGGPNFPIHDFVNQLPYYAAQIPYYANQIPGLVNQFFPAGSAQHPNAAGQRDFETAMAEELGVSPRGDGSFSVDVDVFSTVEAYVIHAAVPGAKKSDIDVSYDAAKNSVLISGVVQRPAEVDEVMLAAMIEGGREVGLFERKVFLDDNVKVDAEGLRAKLEDGLLRIELPKMREDDWTDLKKVAVE